MSGTRDFVVQTGLLKRYQGEDARVVLPREVTAIGEQAFAYCKTLTSITVPLGVKQIGEKAFLGCTALETLQLPDRLKTIGSAAFRGCRSLADGDGFVVVNGVLYDYFGPGGELSILENVSEIDDEAFLGKAELAGIMIPGTVKRIGKWAFSGCRSLRAAELADGVQRLGERAFSGCDSLERLCLPGSVSRIGEGAFFGCVSLKKLCIPEGVTEISREAFYNCRGLESANLPGSLQKIGVNAFYGCENVTFSGPDPVLQLLMASDMEIRKGVLRKYCGTGGRVRIPEGISRIGDFAFYGCKGLKSVSIPESVTEIGEGAFGGCEKLEKLRIPSGVKKIPKQCFWCCRGLKHMELPDGLTEIGPEAFAGCEMLQELRLPETVKKLGEGAFWGCIRCLEPDVPETLSREMRTEGCLLGALDEESMAAAIAAHKKWPKAKREQFLDTYLCSDTRAAQLLAEKRKELEIYAALREMSAEELRDRELSDLGLDMQGRKEYDLGNQSVFLRMLRDFSFTVELPDGTETKTLPKKGANPAKYDAANKDFAQVKKNVRKVWKNRADLLLGDFISGKERKAANWEKTYGSNPILHAVACLLVWQQGEDCFIRTDEGLERVDGSPYRLTEKPVRVAHPMEMQPEELERWRQLFTRRGLKQPFQQIWERAYDPKEIESDRYAGCPILFFQLEGAGKHGFDHRLEIPGCDLDVKWSSETAPNGKQLSFGEIRRFTIYAFSRAVNHALAYLDRVTILGRIQKDDGDVVKSLEGCSLAQLTEYIGAAQRAGAVNVLPLLLDYANRHFGELDPMAEFTLE